MREFKNENELLEEVARLDCDNLSKSVGFIDEDERDKVFQIIKETSRNLIYLNSSKNRYQIDNIGYYKRKPKS